MKKKQKRKLQLRQKTINESLTFQTKFGAKQKLENLSAKTEARLTEEILIFQNMGIAEDLLTLKNIIDDLKIELGLLAEPSEGILAGSYTAYSLGLEPTNPIETGNNLNPLNLNLPLDITISFDNEIRNQAVDWMKAQGYEVTTYLGQPLLKLKQTRVLIRRVVKS